MGTIADTGFRADTFEEHMHPAIEWVDNPEFDVEFDRLLALQEARRDSGTSQAEGLQQGHKETPTTAAQTNPVDPRTGAPTQFPAFINIRFEDGNAIVTMRGDPEIVPADGDSSEYVKAGKQTEATFTSHDWDQFVAEATRERGLVPGG